MKLITDQNQWALVAQELEAEQLKPASYDQLIIERLPSITGAHILDYGCGPGVLPRTLQLLGAESKAFDISPQMRRLCGEKIGHENIYTMPSDIPEGSFDFITCNLVLCIVDEAEASHITRNLRKAIGDRGVIYVGFCNPRIFNIPETQFNFRMPTAWTYASVHKYEKVKKEGQYRIIECHRWIGWYQNLFWESGLTLKDMFFTPEYILKNHRIQDFVVFELVAM